MTLPNCPDSLCVSNSLLTKIFLSILVVSLLVLPSAIVSSTLPIRTQITVVSDERHPERFGTYVREILATEGFLGVKLVSLGDLDSHVLMNSGVLILTESRFNGVQLKEITQWVKSGGRVIGLRSDPRLAGMFGLRYRFEGFESGYLRMNLGSRLGQGTEAEALQLHTRSDLYDLEGAEAAAYLFQALTDRPRFPAIATHRYGEGKSILFTYNLPKNIVLTRQGDPNETDKESDFVRGPLRGSDLFVGMIDNERRAIPQADIQQMIFSKALASLLAEYQPVPLVWKFPNAKRSIMIMTGDHHGGIDEPVVEEMQLVEKYGGSMTIYVMSETRWECSDAPSATRETQPSRQTILSWKRGRHEVAQHINLYGLEEPGTNYLPAAAAEAAIAQSQRAFHAKYGIRPRTVRTHGIQWVGWVEQARIYADHGIQMGLDFVSIGSPKRSMGYMCGSGMAMRFADEKGRVLNVFHQPTLFEDDVLLSQPPTKTKLLATPRCPHQEPIPGMDQEFDGLSTSDALLRVERMFNDSVNRYHTPMSFNIHPPFMANFSKGFLIGSLELARRLDMPIVGAEQWLDFLLSREGVKVLDLRWESNVLRFRLAGVNSNLTWLLPLRLGTGAVFRKARAQDEELRADPRQLFGFDWIFLTVNSNKSELDFEIQYSR